MNEIEQRIKEKHGAIDVTLDYIQRDIADIKKKLDNHYVTQEEFKPIKMIVYGMVAFILIAVLGSVIYLVIK